MAKSQERINKPNFSEPESSSSNLNRRQFIGLSTTAAATLVFPQSARAEGEMIRSKAQIALGSQRIAPPSLTSPSDTNFFQPNVITSAVNSNNSYGTLTSELNIYPKPYSDLDVNDPKTYVRAFKQVKPTPPTTVAPRLAPAPTLCVNPGDRIELQVVNQLAANTVPPPSSGNIDSTYCPAQMENSMNHPNCLDTTNMHFHGLHVSPISLNSDGKPVSAGNPNFTSDDIQLSSDDVLYELEPEHTHQYCPWLPAFHAPGTHWYHSHRHGSTAIQVAGGMVGTIIIKEPPGQEICPGAPDVVMMIQEQPQSLTKNDYTDRRGNLDPAFNKLTAQEKLDRGIYERVGLNGGGTTGKFLVNGATNPTLNLQKGEIQRWRLINANSTPRAFMGLELREGSLITGAIQALYRVAVDGITLYGKPMDHPSVKFDGVRKNPSIPFALGNRVDLLVNLEPGTYTLWKRKDNINAPNTSADEALASIIVDGTTTFKDATKVAASFQNLLDNGIPETGIPAYLASITDTPIPNITPVVFQTGGPVLPTDRVTSPGRGKFQISNTQYKPTGGEKSAPSGLDKIPQSGLIDSMVADLGSTQEWIIANSSGAAHPFHVHINPFLVVETADINGIKIQPTDTTEQIYRKLQDANWTKNSNTPEGNGIDPTIWWDTFTIAPQKAYKIRHRFDDFWGTYVLHCHVLIHEDQGMMWNVTVNNVNNKGANPCQQLLKPIEI
ncbi:MAG: multicopper oxidase domain-containing protein [Cyanobacteria bacterium P01_G01_bin.39]